MAKGYWIAHVDVRDPEGYKDYVAAAKLAFDKYRRQDAGARRRLSRRREGRGRARNVVIEFPSLKAAQDCYHSPEYQAARAIRRRNMPSRNGAGRRRRSLIVDRRRKAAAVFSNEHSRQYRITRGDLLRCNKSRLTSMLIIAESRFRLRSRPGLRGFDVLPALRTQPRLAAAGAGLCRRRQAVLLQSAQSVFAHAMGPLGRGAWPSCSSARRAATASRASTCQDDVVDWKSVAVTEETSGRGRSAT